MTDLEADYRDFSGQKATVVKKIFIFLSVYHNLIDIRNGQFFLAVVSVSPKLSKMKQF